MEDMVYENEVEVLCSVMEDKELLNMNEKLGMMINEKAYQTERFPLSCGEIRWMQAIVMFMYWMRRGKGVEVMEGEVVVCELEDSPFVKKYREREKVERDSQIIIIDDVMEEVVEEKGEWV